MTFHNTFLSEEENVSPFIFGPCKGIRILYSKNKKKIACGILILGLGIAFQLMESKIPLTIRIPLTGNLESSVWSTEFTDWNPESKTGLERAVYTNCILGSSPLYTPKQCSSQSFEQLIYFICHNDISLCAFCVVKVHCIK